MSDYQSREKPLRYLPKDFVANFVCFQIQGRKTKILFNFFRYSFPLNVVNDKLEISEMCSI